MDWSSIISEIGGGLPAVVILALAFWVHRQQKRLDGMVDRAFEREREHTKELTETIGAVKDVTHAISGVSK